MPGPFDGTPDGNPVVNLYRPTAGSHLMTSAKGRPLPSVALGISETQLRHLQYLLLLLIRQVKAGLLYARRHQPSSTSTQVLHACSRGSP